MSKVNQLFWQWKTLPAEFIYRQLLLHLIWYWPLTCGDRVISVQHGQCHGYWCSGSLRRQDTSSHDIDCVEYVGYGFTWHMILGICVVSMWSNFIKCKYMYIFSSRRELTVFSVWVMIHMPGNPQSYHAIICRQSICSLCLTVSANEMSEELMVRHILENWPYSFCLKAQRCNLYKQHGILMVPTVVF